MDAGAWSCGMVAGLIHDVPDREGADRPHHERGGPHHRQAAQRLHAGFGIGLARQAVFCPTRQADLTGCRLRPAGAFSAPRPQPHHAKGPRHDLAHRPHRPPSRPLHAVDRARARDRHRSGPDPRAVGRRRRHQGRQPVLSRRHVEGRGDPRRAQGPHRPGPGPAQAAPGPARVHDRHLRRHPQRHARDALLADRPRGHATTRCASISAPPGSPARSPSSPATSRRSARWPRCSSTTGRRSSCRTARSIPAHDPKTGETHRPRERLPGRRPSRRRVSPPHRLPRLPRHRQLRRHVHLQHHADLHRRGRHAAAAHGGAAVRRSAPRRTSSPASWSIISRT